MKLELSKIIVDPAKRVRKDNGDMDALKESIAQVGLIQPLIVDENNVLLAGFRRYSSCLELGLTEVEVQVVECGGDRHKLLDIELAENMGRKDFTEEELADVQRLRDEIDRDLRGTGWDRLKCWFKGCFALYR